MTNENEKEKYIKIIWTEVIDNHCQEWKRITFHYCNQVFDIIIHRFGYNDFLFFYETQCELNLIEKEKIEDYLIEKSKEDWYDWR